MLRIPESLAKEWMPMLDQLIEWNLIHGFMGKLLDKLSEVGSDQDRSILAWMCFVCNGWLKFLVTTLFAPNYWNQCCLYVICNKTDVDVCFPFK